MPPLQTYRIRAGETFHDVVNGEARAHTGGEEIQLEDDIARQHAHRIERVHTSVQQLPAEPAATPAKGAAAAGKAKAEG